MTVINTYGVEPTADGAHIRLALEVPALVSGPSRPVPGRASERPRSGAWGRHG
jgi:hypothetical protein